MPITNIRSEWVSGNLVFYEDAVGQSIAGDILRIGTGAVTVGEASQDVDFKVFLGASDQYVLFDAGAALVTFAKVDVQINGDLTLDLEDIQIGDNNYLQFGDATGGDVSARWVSATSLLEILPAVDNTGKIYIGNGTVDLDVRIFLGTATAYVDFNVTAASLVVSAGVITSIDDVTDSSSTVTGSIHTDGGLGVAKAAFIGGLVNIAGVLTSANATDASSATAAGTVVTGGLGIAKALWVGTTSRLVGVVTCDGIVSLDDVTDTSSTVTGSLHTDGGVGIAKALWVGTTSRLVGLVTTDAGVTVGTVLLTGVGAVGAPSVQIGAADTGLYLVSATQTGFAQDGVAVVYFDDDGIKPNSVQVRVALGTAGAGTVTFKEYGDGRDMTTVLTLTAFIIGAPGAAAAAKGFGNIVYAFPAGIHLELVASLSAIVLTAAGTAVASVTGLGSVVASGVIAVLSGTATFEDRLAGQTINTAAGGGAAVSALKAATAGIGLGISLNVAASVKNVFLNSAGTWNADNSGNLTATGTIVLKWTRMG